MGLSSDEENDGCTAPNPKKRKLNTSRSQKFRSEWKSDVQAFGKEVSLWLRSDPSTQFKARCSWCDTSFTANKSVIEKHCTSKKHLTEKRERESTPSVASSFASGSGQNINKTHKTAVKRAEIILAACLAAHNISMQFIDHLVPALQSAFPDSAICKGIDMQRKKCTRVVTNVIGAVHKEDLSETLKVVKFSIMTDESTHHNIKTAAVAVRFFDKNAGKHGRVVTKMWDLSDLFPKGDFEAARQGGNSDRLFFLLIEAFEKKGIPFENFIGFASDGAAVMLGVNNSVMTRLLDRFPGIIIMRCICHSLHLAGKDASKLLPRACEDLARFTYNFFKLSSKRVAQFAEFQAFLEVAEHKMLLLSMTRWLCFRDTVDRILEQWEALRLYLTDARHEDNTHGTNMLYQWLCDPVIKAYYLFLSWVLPKVAAMNAYFQSNKVVVTSLFDKMAEGYRDLLQSYLKPTYVSRTPLELVDPRRQEEFAPVSNIYLGVKVIEQLKNPSITPPQVEDFKKRCRDYLIALCEGIKNRFDFADPLLQAIPTLKPKSATSFSTRQFSNSILPLLDLVPRAKPTTADDLQALDYQWRRLPLDQDIPREILEEEEVDVFWARIRNLKDSEGAPRYEVLGNFVLAVLSLPHSNADVERIFSKISLIRTRLRNRLITSTVEGLCLASECVKSNGSCCKAFEPTPKMIDSMNSTTLYPPKAAESQATGTGTVANLYCENH